MDLSPSGRQQSQCRRRDGDQLADGTLIAISVNKLPRLSRTRAEGNTSASILKFSMLLVLADRWLTHYTYYI
jgi:hypothetical protein